MILPKPGDNGRKVRVSNPGKEWRRLFGQKPLEGTLSTWTEGGTSYVRIGARETTQLFDNADLEWAS